MALLTKKEFSARTGIKSKHLSVYISRKKIAADENGMIDDQLEMNAAFLRGHGGKPVREDKTKLKPVKDPAAKKRQKDAESMFSLEKEQKEVAILKIKKDSALLDMKMRKMHGELVPTDLMRLTFQHIFREMSVGLKQEFEKMITDIAKKNKFNVNQLAELRGQMIKTINAGIDRGTDSSKKALKNILSEYSQSQKAA